MTRTPRNGTPERPYPECLTRQFTTSEQRPEAGSGIVRVSTMEQRLSAAGPTCECHHGPLICVIEQLESGSVRRRPHSSRMDHRLPNPVSRNRTRCGSTRHQSPPSVSGQDIMALNRDKGRDGPRQRRHRMLTHSFLSRPTRPLRTH